MPEHDDRAELLAGLDRGLRELREHAATVAATADSADGLVRATVDGRGGLLDLELDDRIFRAPDSRALAASILATVEAATAAASDSVAGRAAELFPTDRR